MTTATATATRQDIIEAGIKLIYSQGLTPTEAAREVADRMFGAADESVIEAFAVEGLAQAITAGKSQPGASHTGPPPAVNPSAKEAKSKIRDDLAFLHDISLVGRDGRSYDAFHLSREDWDYRAGTFQKAAEGNAQQAAACKSIKELLDQHHITRVADGHKDVQRVANKILAQGFA
jgi:hypothetical protein